MAKYTRREYQLGPYWLGQRGDSPAWYRCWIEAGRTKRASLGTTDFEQAKETLTKWFYENRVLGEENLSPAKMPLADVILDYWNHQAIKLRSADTVKIHLRYWNDFWEEASVADVRSVAKQEEFQEWLTAKGLKDNSVNRCLEAGRAAMRRAYKRGAITSAPFVHMIKVREEGQKGKALSIEELRAFYLGSEQKHWRDLVYLLTATAARPEAITSLTKAQMDFDAGLIYLNPEGRKQTNKHRPTVKLTDGARERFEGYPDGRLLIFHGKPMDRPETVVRKARERAKLDKSVTLYSIRHTCARWMRMEGVDTAEIANQLGHRKFGADMTLRYMPHSPAYLTAASAALDKLCKAAFF